jgi:hypothetical protein
MRKLVSMTYRLLADLVLLAHAAFVAFVALGGLAVVRWPRAAWVHVPAMLWGAGIEFVGGICPLTPLENHWRQLAGERGYAGGFVEHYVVPTLYPDGLTRRLQITLGIIVVMINAIVYICVVWRRRQSAS